MVKAKKGTWHVELEATDGRECYWRFENCTLSHVRNIVKGYVESCVYDCKWTIQGITYTAVLITGESIAFKTFIKEKIIRK